MMFKADALCFEQDDSRLIHPLSFLLSPGEFLYISGKNGAGKTTLLKLLAGVLLPTSGTLSWHDQPLKHYPEKINYIGHKSAITLTLTPTENLYFLSQGYTTKTTISDALTRVGLTSHQDTPAALLSAGQIRRIALAKLILLDTPLWLLDEPYTSLDHDGVTWLQTLIHEHLAHQGCVIMTSHQTCGIKTPNQHYITL